MTLNELISRICAKPEMYVRQRDFNLVVAYINGFDCALSMQISPPLDGGRKVQRMDGFRTWIAERLYETQKMPRNYAWWSYVNELYPEDETALKKFPILFNEYFQSVNETDR